MGMIFSVHFLGTLLRELSAGHARHFQPEGASFGPFRQEFRVKRNSAANRWNGEENVREGYLEAATAAQQQACERTVGILVCV